MRSGVVGFGMGGGAVGSMVSMGIKWWGEGKTNEKAWLQRRLGIFNYLLVFATVRLTVRAPILGFCEKKNTT